LMLLTEEWLKGFCKGILARVQLGLHNSLLVHDDTSLSLLSVKQIAYHKNSPNGMWVWTCNLISGLAQQ
jgi:hypothetical protein